MKVKVDTLTWCEGKMRCPYITTDPKPQSTSKSSQKHLSLPLQLLWDLLDGYARWCLITFFAPLVLWGGLPGLEREVLK